MCTAWNENNDSQQHEHEHWLMMIQKEFNEIDVWAIITTYRRVLSR